MVAERPELDFGDDTNKEIEADDGVDVTSIIGHAGNSSLTDEQKKSLTDEAKHNGFVSRDVSSSENKETVPKQPSRRRRRVSPYTQQFGGKCRPGMKELFKKIAERIDVYDTEAIELSILALIEKNGYKDLKSEYENIVKS